MAVTKIMTIGVIVVTLGLQAVGWMISGQIGYERGDSYANWQAHFDAARNRKTMEQIGVCRWAVLSAGCKFQPSN